MTTILKNPTIEEINKVRDRERRKTIFRLEKENIILKNKVGNQELEIQRLKSLIENVRQDWGRVGADKAIQNLLER